MGIHLKERLNIYLNGTDGAKDLTFALLTMWLHFFDAAGALGAAFIAFVLALSRVLLVLVAPFFFWIAPIISLFTAHRIVPEAEMRQRLRDGMHKNGPV
jgi:Na+/melibiose symporter-like transporter